MNEAGKPSLRAVERALALLCREERQEWEVNICRAGPLCMGRLQSLFPTSGLGWNKIEGVGGSVGRYWGSLQGEAS